FTLIGAVWSESFDGTAVPSGWASQATFGSNSWTITTARSHSPTKSYFAPAPSSKTTAHLVSPAISIPAGATDLQLKFWHDFDLQSRWDGGRFELSVDGGAWFDVEDGGSGAAFASNGYNTTILDRGKPSDRSEFAGRRAWSGSSNGFVETIVNLTDTAKYAGHDLQLRWSIATNQGSSSPGWHVDSVALVGGGDIGNQPPEIVVAADSSSSETETDTTDGTVYEVVRAAAVDLSVTADDDGGEAGLSYTWSVAVGPGPAVFFTPNGGNTAKLTTANFEGAGDYRLVVSVSDPEGLTVTSDVNVRVVPEASGVVVSPDVASVVVGNILAFSATETDQFGEPMAVQPGSFTWAVSGGGTIDSGGLFTAASAGGPFVVTADSSSFTGTGNVTVNPAPATVTLGDLAQTYDGSPKPVSVTTDPAGLAVSVTYDGSPTVPTGAGSYAVAATVTDPNYQGDASGTLVILIPDFEWWQDQHFTAQEQIDGLADPTADPDLDGIKNLLEYALGGNPRVPDATGIVGVIQEDQAATERLALVFRRPVGLADVSYTVEATDQLDAPVWQEVFTLEIESGPDPGTETVTAWDVVASDQAARRFMRLRVEMLSP
ncbi:MAG: hypothetical protein HKO57_00355, partial [Akkermansiaceae bacterium]|nr:hypothetical protein [Akkermansiaceae bacterium]